MALKPLPLLSERNNTTLATVVISVTAKDSVTISFLNHNTIVLMNNFLKLLNCVVIETVLDLVKKESIILTISFQLENVPF